MPIIKSAIKRVRKTKRQTQRNLITKNKFKTLLKEFHALVTDKKLEDAARLYPQVQKAIDLAVKKNVLHANNGARKKSSLAKLIRDVKVSGVKANPEKKVKPTAEKKEVSPKKKTPAKKK